MRYYGIVIAAIGIDQATKLWVRFHMHLGETLVIWQDVLHFTYYRNSGAAGSTFQGYGRYFIIPAVLFVLYMAYAASRGSSRTVWPRREPRFSSAARSATRSTGRCSDG